ncbi:MAG TPA: DNA polymerase III subunit delta [Bacillota bacterium]|nr:DNA polymerase III subunit delta [Bacillota bacterium]
MSYTKLMQQLKRNQIPPVSLLYGTESYFIQNLKNAFKKTVLTAEENLSTYDLEEIPIQEVVADAETYPFFGGEKLIIATNPSFLKAKPDKLPFEHDVETLQHYISRPSDYTVLVFVAPYEKIDARKKITKALKKQAVVAECNPVKPYEIDKWIKNMADELQITITEDAFEIIEFELATNLQLLESELEKLALYVGEGGTVTTDVAEKLISHTTDHSALQLVDAVISRNLSQAISIYKDLEKMNEEPIALIGLLAFQFRTILQVKLLKKKGYNSFQMQKKLGVHPYVIKIASKREKQFSTQQLKAIMNRLASTDAMMKTGHMEKDIAFELLLHDLVRAS